MTAPTYGQAAPKLRELGYSPASGIMPHLAVDGVRGVTLDAPPAHLISEHPAAVMGVAVLLLEPLADGELAARRNGVLGALLAGPSRIGSDGVVLHVLQTRFDARYHEAAALGARFFPRTLVPLDGHWPAGTLLDGPYTSLPSSEGVAEAFARLAALPSELAAERAPPPKPSRSAWLGAAR
jgi:hypothetical protein